VTLPRHHVIGPIGYVGRVTIDGRTLSHQRGDDWKARLPVPILRAELGGHLATVGWIEVAWTASRAVIGYGFLWGSAPGIPMDYEAHISVRDATVIQDAKFDRLYVHWQLESVVIGAGSAWPGTALRTCGPPSWYLQREG
jgi:hypothetical protein